MNSPTRIVLISTAMLSIMLAFMTLLISFVIVKSLNKEISQEAMYKKAFDVICLEFRKNNSDFDCDKRVKLTEIVRSDPETFDRMFYSHTFVDSENKYTNPVRFDVSVYLDGDTSKPHKTSTQ